MLYVKESFKIIGYIARDSLGRIGGVEKECIVAGTEELIKTFLRRLGNPELDPLALVGRPRIESGTNGLKVMSLIFSYLIYLCF